MLKKFEPTNDFVCDFNWCGFLYNELYFNSIEYYTVTETSSISSKVGLLTVYPTKTLLIDSTENCLLSVKISVKVPSCRYVLIRHLKSITMREIRISKKGK